MTNLQKMISFISMAGLAAILVPHVNAVLTTLVTK